MSAAPARPAVRRRQGSTALTLLAAVTALLFAYLYVPILVIVILSFNESELAALPVRGITLRWFGQTLRNPHLMEGLRNSVIVGVAVVAVTVPLGVMLAYGMTRRVARKAGSALAALVTLPMQTPRIILAVLLLLLFGALGVRPSLVTVFLSHVVLTMPFVTLIVAARLRGIDTAMEEAASDLGASRLRVWLEVLLPLLAPAIVAAALIAFTISFDEMVVSYFTIGTESTLPVVIWSMVNYGYTQEINAIGTIVIAFTVALVVIAQLLQRERGTKASLS